MTKQKKGLGNGSPNQQSLFADKFDLSGLEDEIKEQMSAVARKFPLSRYQIAAKISERVNREISKSMIDALMSTGKSDYHLNIDVVAAFCTVLNNFTPLKIAAEAVGQFLVDRTDIVYVEVAQINQKIAELNAKKQKLESAIR